MTWAEIEGATTPAGATYCKDSDSWNFVITSIHASKVTLLIYTRENQTTPLRQIELDPIRHKSGPIWHYRIKASEIPGARYYAYKIDGPISEDGAFHYFDADKILLDPYARSVYFPPRFSREAACAAGPNDGKAPLGVLLKPEKFDWEETRPCHNDQLIIYEMHVRGFTKHSSSGVREDKRGTFAGVTEKVPYLKELGVTAVELMPIYQFDPQEKNYWGYMPINFFAPHSKYASSEIGEDQIREFKEMVKALHRANIEVILDVVYNHTGEGGIEQPLYSFKGIDNSQYYIRSKDPSSPFANFSGCGNTLNTSNVAVRALIVESLKYWREVMHIDGFRFDLASIFARKHDGTINSERPPIFAQIRSSRDLADVRLIAEPWDAAGAYQLGRGFPGWLWIQWNARFRDTIQHFVRGDNGFVSELMTRLYGSCDLFPDSLEYSCRPWQSLNYISSHDGSSLYDMVSFEQKRNWANGEENRDGCFEAKWNCGWEGNDNVPDEVMQLRKQQVKNFFCLLLLANGTPMFRMGDEFMQTQGGNNNPYNQDNETSWLNWDLLKRNMDIFRFVKQMIAFRKKQASICRPYFWRADVHWYGTHGGGVDTSEASRCLAFFLNGDSENADDLYVMINGDDREHNFRINNQNSNAWNRVVNTALLSPDDFCENDIVQGDNYNVKARSIVVLTRKN